MNDLPFTEENFPKESLFIYNRTIYIVLSEWKLSDSGRKIVVVNIYPMCGSLPVQFSEDYMPKYSKLPAYIDAIV